MSQSKECVKVMVRCRPLNKSEQQKGCKSCVQLDTKLNQIILEKPNENQGQKTFRYDAVFTEESLQQTIYEQSAFPLVESVFQGYNGTIFVYGQTGCGKTHTMMGDPLDSDLKGIIPRSFQHIISMIEQEDSAQGREFLIRCSYIEIYNEEIHDLLSGDVKEKYELKEDPNKGVYVKDLNKVIVKSVKEMEKLMMKGNSSRSVGETAMNKDSSRSHSIFTVYVESSQEISKEQQRFTAGKLNLVDLAGSERQSKTLSSGVRLQEANKINLSLSALGNVISALVDGKGHVPYRDSKLTRLLQDSLGGNTKTIMIANISPADYNYDETWGTLRYADRAKHIKNEPKINEDPKDAMLRQYQEEINRLKAALENGGGGEQKVNVHENKENFEEIQKLKQIKDELHQDKERIQKQLIDREIEIENEKQKKTELENLLKQYETQKMKGGQGTDEKEKKKYQEVKSRLKKQLKLQEQLIEENRKKEEEMFIIEKNYKNSQEEAEQLRKVVSKLQQQLKEALSEIKDIEKDNEEDKEELLEAVRELQKEVKFNKGVINMIMNEKDYDSIRQQSQWSEDKKNYIIVPFLLKEKQIKFPRLPANQAMDLVQQDKATREVEIRQNTQETENNFKYNESEDGFSRGRTKNQQNQNNNQNYQDSKKNNVSKPSSLQDKHGFMTDESNLRYYSAAHQGNEGNTLKALQNQICKNQEMDTSSNNPLSGKPPKQKVNLNAVQLNPLQNNKKPNNQTNGPRENFSNTQEFIPLKQNPRGLQPLNMQQK